MNFYYWLYNYKFILPVELNYNSYLTFPVIPELPQIKSSSDERNFGGRMMWRVIKGHVNRDCIRRIPNVSQMTQKKLYHHEAGTRANYLINLLIWFVTFKSVKSDPDTIGNKNRIKSWRFSVMDESGDDVMVAAHCGRLRNYSCLCSALSAHCLTL